MGGDRFSFLPHKPSGDLTESPQLEKPKSMHTQWTENADSSLRCRYLHMVTGPPTQDVPRPTPPPPLRSLTQTLLSHPNLIAFSYNKYPRAWDRADRGEGCWPWMAGPSRPRERGKVPSKAPPTQKREDFPQWSGISGLPRHCGDPRFTSPFTFACVDAAVGFQEKTNCFGEERGGKKRLHFPFKHKVDNRCL